MNGTIFHNNYVDIHPQRSTYDFHSKNIINKYFRDDDNTD